MHDSLKIMSANLKEAAEKQHNDNN